MPGEYTPLITTVRVRPPRQRYTAHNVCRRFCTIAITSTLIAFTFSFLFALLTTPPHRHRQRNPYEDSYGWAWRWLSESDYSHERLVDVLLDTPSPKLAEEWSRYYTSGPHLAGKNFTQAAWTRDKWNEWGVQSGIVDYDVYLNYPVDHSLSLLEKSKKEWKVAFKASLEEDVLDEDPTSGLADRIPTFHGYSASGNVTAPFVYVNYGTYQDFEDLLKANVTLKGNIAIARYGLIFRGLKVKRAQELGMVGVVLFSDPGDDGGVTEEHGYKAYPDGPARNPSSVQRGSAQYISVAPGDPTTPGYPSKPGVPRQPIDHAAPQIPSIPISYADALPILKALNGIGPKATDFNYYWQRNLGLGYKGVKYNIGPSPDSVVLNLYNQQEYVTTPLWNVIGVINGTIPDEVIVVGNHRDAWIAGGAADPNSGSAVLNEVVRSFGEALKEGWKPMRTIVFASWDGEEYALIGSTEWVEEYLPWLSGTAVAYLNVDVGCSGPHFAASAAPLLSHVLRDAVTKVPSPKGGNWTVGDLWDGRISTMGSGSDFTAFQDHAGIPSLDMSFRPVEGGPVYQYHSNYDSFHWMEKFGDPGFRHHVAMAQVLGLMTAELSNQAVLPILAGDYAEDLYHYVDKVESKVHDLLSPDAPSAAHASAETEEEMAAKRGTFLGPAAGPGKETPAEHLHKWFESLRGRIATFREKSERLDERAAELAERYKAGVPWWKFWEKIELAWSIRQVNTRYKFLERNFLFEGGLDGRPWFKHVVFAPGLWTGYAGAVFPGLDESIDAKDWPKVYKWLDIISGCISMASRKIAM